MLTVEISDKCLVLNSFPFLMRTETTNSLVCVLPCPE